MRNQISPTSGTDTRVDGSSDAVQQDVRHAASQTAGAMNTLGLKPRPDGLDRRHAHAMPPRRAVLLWPNRDVSEGTLTGSPASGLTFHPSSINGPLAERKAIYADISVEDLRALLLQSLGYSASANLSGRSPRGIEVVPSPEVEVSALPWVRPKLLDTVPGVDLNLLRGLADVASGVGGTAFFDRLRLPAMISAALSSMKDGWEDPVAMRRARAALDRESNFVFVEQAEELASGAPGKYSFSKFLTDANAHQTLQSLNDGDHLLLRVVQTGAEGAHAMTISATRLGEGHVRLSVFNPNGWGIAGAPRSPAVFKTMSMVDAVAALQTFDEQGRFGPAVDLPQPWLERWGDASVGIPMLSWLSNAGPRESMPLPSEQRMTPQKSGDCGIEVEFAWLASVLPPADYKLAKAHVLNVLAQAAETAGRSEPELQRLRDRITTSLSGYAVSPPLEGGGARTPGGPL